MSIISKLQKKCKPDDPRPFKLTKPEVLKYFTLLYKQLDNVDYIVFRKLRTNWGYFVTLPAKNVSYIELDPREPILPTLVHELIHSLLPELSENEVLSLEASLINRLTIRQYRKLLEKALPKIKFKKLQ